MICGCCEFAGAVCGLFWGERRRGIAAVAGEGGGVGGGCAVAGGAVSFAALRGPGGGVVAVHVDGERGDGAGGGDLRVLGRGGFGEGWEICGGEWGRGSCGGG